MCRCWHFLHLVQTYPLFPIWTLHYTEWGIILILCVLESHPHFIFHCRLSQITLDFINKLINLNFTFRTPFKISIKDILMATFFNTHDGVKLGILQTLTEVFLRHITFCRRKAFYGDVYDKIQELSNFNFKGNVFSHFKKLKGYVR